MNDQIITFNIFCGGTLDDYFDDDILICTNKASGYHIQFSNNEIAEKVIMIDDLFELIVEKASLDNSVKEMVTREYVYLFFKGMLYKIADNKTMKELYAFTNTNCLDFYLFVIGGASINIDCGYKLMIHTDESIHRNMPHVHVMKDGYSVRYLLEPVERITGDACNRDFLRDEKKIIVPGIRKNLAKLWDMWRAYNGGFIPPMIDFEAKQYYSES